MGLFGLLKRKPVEKQGFYQDDLDHLDKDGELPWGWFSANLDFTEQIQNEYRIFLNAWIESRRKSPKEEYAALKSFVTYMNDVKSLCYSKGECFDFWRKIQFDDEYLNERTEELQYIQAHFGELEAKYKEKLRMK